MVLHCEVEQLPRFPWTEDSGTHSRCLSKYLAHTQTQFHQSPGCYVHDDWLPVSVFYKWLDAILDIEDNGRLQGITLHFVCDSNMIYHRTWKHGIVPLPW
jgi:hypothetical protein